MENGQENIGFVQYQEANSKHNIIEFLKGLSKR
jgi:hypothetical protein